MQFKLEILFDTFTELDEFVAVYKKINIRSEIKAIKTVDKRGSKTSELHRKAKEYKKTHQEMTYRECLISVAKNQMDEEQTDDEPNEDYKENISEVKPIVIKMK